MARTLHELLDGVAGGGAGTAEPARLLAESGFGDLAPDLLVAALTSYADLAPLEVAERLAPFVTHHSPAALAGDEEAGPVDDPAFDDPSVAFGLLAPGDQGEVADAITDEAAVLGPTADQWPDALDGPGADRAEPAGSGDGVDIGFGSGAPAPDGVDDAEAELDALLEELDRVAAGELDTAMTADLAGPAGEPLDGDAAGALPAADDEADLAVQQDADGDDEPEVGPDGLDHLDLEG